MRSAAFPAAPSTRPSRSVSAPWGSSPGAASGSTSSPTSPAASSPPSPTRRSTAATERRPDHPGGAGLRAGWFESSSNVRYSAAAHPLRPCQGRLRAKHLAWNLSGMNNEVLWLIRLGIDQKLFTREQALATAKAIGRNAELMDFAQRLIDDSVVHDVEKLETIAGNAMARAQVGPPASNPLLEDSAPPMPAGATAARAGADE